MKISCVSENSRTDKLYYKDSHLYNFTASCISSEKSITHKGLYEIILDKTAFFPEGGGQSADSGELIAADTVIRVKNVIERDNYVIHFSDSPIPLGADVRGEIDQNTRLRRMQNHSGEHIVSGIVHKKFGFENVGFHLGTDVTLDFDGILSESNIAEIEYLANKVVVSNIPIKATFFSVAELENTAFRSKIDFAAAGTNTVRIVTIDGVDVCACCAPHVSSTGEIGIIKLTNFIKYKGGVRIWMKCGFDALDDYIAKSSAVADIAESMSAKADDIVPAFNRLNSELAAQKAINSELKYELIDLKTNNILPNSNGCLLYFDANADMDTLRHAANKLILREDVRCVALFSGTDSEYKYIVIGRKLSLKNLAQALNSTLNGKGGGKNDMITGALAAAESEIRDFFDSYSIDSIQQL